MPFILYGIYLFLAVFNAGNMVTLQIQHYGIYPAVGKENFRNYIQANNNAAKVPSIIPALLLLLVNFGMIFIRPAFISFFSISLFLLLNIIALLSTFIWQRKLQSEMALTGYDDLKINKLISTNWIRTIVFLIQAILAVILTIKELK
jgi:hypothetical protein